MNFCYWSHHTMAFYYSNSRRPVCHKCFPSPIHGDASFGWGRFSKRCSWDLWKPRTPLQQKVAQTFPWQHKPIERVKCRLVRNTKTRLYLPLKCHQEWKTVTGQSIWIRSGRKRNKEVTEEYMTNVMLGFYMGLIQGYPLNPLSLGNPSSH